ncbi:SMI1/KNR4 family protein [Paenibacillus sp. LMG 31459]|uniref:SMI1/KNR4 family protein n=1 Tax=Paenibacillus phytohabitans TaxID=2654978 RepID=A0ABX1YGY5_9BACL|nr:SMI1/KNR4 family protein [Paenibacillus phytohabitans]NOU79416.1 SMI1/KNR4 family protein [Paenibacillus phytohabitans]
MNVESLFEICYQKHPGASEPELTRFTEEWQKPLTQEEIAEITGRQRNPFPVNDPLYAVYRPFDPALWTIPDLPLPAAYLSFLRYSNGGEFGNGERYVQLFGTDQLRSMMLAYEFPEYMPGGVPFAMDGSGHHYIWDMRTAREDGAYPILIAHSGNLGYEDAAWIAGSFEELCRGTVSAEDVLYNS